MRVGRNPYLVNTRLFHTTRLLESVEYPTYKHFCTEINFKVKGTMPYDFDPDTEQDFSKKEKEAIQDSIAKFNEEMNGCLRIV